MSRVVTAIHRLRAIDWGHAAAVAGTALVLLGLMILVGSVPFPPT